MNTYLVTIPVKVPDNLDVDVCGVISRLINIGLEDAQDTAENSLDHEAKEEAIETVCLKIEEPFMYDDDAENPEFESDSSKCPTCGNRPITYL